MTTKADPEVRVVGSSSDGCQIVVDCERPLRRNQRGGNCGRSCIVANGGLDQTPVDRTAATERSIALDVPALDSPSIPSLVAFTRYCPDDFAAGFASGHI